MGGRGWAGWSGVGAGNGTTVIALSINIFFKKKKLPQPDKGELWKTYS